MPVFFASAQNAESGGVAPRNIDNRYGMGNPPPFAVPGEFVEFIANDVGKQEVSLSGIVSNKSIPYSIIGGSVTDPQIRFVMPNEDVAFDVQFDFPGIE